MVNQLNEIWMNVIILCGLGNILMEGETSEELMILRNMISIGFVTINFDKSDIDWFCEHGQI